MGAIFYLFEGLGNLSIWEEWELQVLWVGRLGFSWSCLIVYLKIEVHIVI